MIYFKRTTDVTGYSIDWSDWLSSDDDYIETSVWNAPVGLIIEDSTEDEGITTATISGGVDGETYEILNVVTSTSNFSSTRRIFVSVSDSLLIRGTNSFASYSSLLRTAALDSMSASTLLIASQEAQQGALQQAWRNIALMSIDIEADSYQYTNVEDLDAATLDTLTTNQMAQLERAQVIEADCILGGSPIEDRRKAGMLSDTTGESGHFLRPARPVELPIYRKTAYALTGILSYSVFISA